MSTQRDYYEVLGLPRTAGKDEVKRRYRELALKLHPDRNKEPDAGERFKEVSEAYAVLSDDEKRRAYDQFGHAGVDQRWRTPEDIFRGADFEDVFGGLGGFGGFEEILGRMFGLGGLGGAGRRGRGRDVRAQVTLTLEEVATGARKRIEVARRAACKPCRGSGAAPGSSRKTCATCRGSGQVRATRGLGGFQFVSVGPCAACRGEGAVLEKPCAGCRGEGLVVERAAVDVDVPQGVREGAVLQLVGGGEPGPRGAPPGDLLVQVAVEPHPRFERRGLDLVAAVAVPFPTAALGGQVEVALLGGGAEQVQILPGTQGGTVLTLEGRGLRSARGGPGDLYLLVQVEVPTKLSGKARDLLRQLQEELGGGPSPGLNLREALQGVLGKLGVGEDREERER